jgi:CDP-diacylglycerol--glycerol-3-phosphate 3-phosphatidyltransferase
MNVPNMLTLSRIILAPFFFLLFYLSSLDSALFIGFYIGIWVLFSYIEISDILDGVIARSKGLVSDMGKVMDPFSDVMSRVTYFVTFVWFGLLHPLFLLLILYREFGILFVRMIMAQRGVALAARSGGKLKSVFYAISAGSLILLYGLQNFGASETVVTVFSYSSLALFIFSVLLSWGSFIDYLRIFFKEIRNKKIE